MKDFIVEHRSFFTSVIVITVAVISSRIIRRLLKRFFDESSEHLNVDATRYRFFRNMVDFVIFTLAGILVFYSIPALRTLGLTLFAGAGIIAAIVGFASQQAFSNIISGIFIVIFRPFRVNDIIKVGNFDSGVVEDITLRHTVIRSFENRRLVIPNTVISEQTVLNSSLVDEKVCMYIDVGISYESDTEKAMNIMRDECERHPFCIDHRSVEQENFGAPAVEVNIINLGETAVMLRAGVWAENAVKGSDMKYQLFLSIKKRFDAEGIEFPFHHRTTVFRK